MAQVDYFLKLDGVDGETLDAKHKGQIEVLSWSWGATNPSKPGQGHGIGKGTVQDINFSMAFNKASPVVAKKLMQGVHFPTAVLYCRKAGGVQQEYLIITLKEVFITGFHTTGSSGASAIPTCSVSMAYNFIEMDYRAQDEKGGLGGSVKFGYNQKTTEVF